MTTEPTSSEGTTPPENDAIVSGGAGLEAGSFIDRLPEAYRKEPMFQNFKSLEDLTKSYYNAQKLIGAKRVAVPGEKATPEEMAAFYASIGRPEKEDGYALPDPATLLPKTHKVDPEFGKLFKSLAFKSGLTPRQAETFYNGYYTALGESLKKQSENAETQKSARKESLRQAFGDDLPKVASVADRVLNKFGTPEFKNLFLANGLESNPEAVRFLSNVGKYFTEDQLGKAQGTSQNAMDAQMEIKKLQGNADFSKAYLNPLDLGHKDAVARMKALHQMAYPE